MAIFPEGTRIKSEEAKRQNQPKDGVLHFARKLNTPIMPMAIDGTFKVGTKVTVIAGKPFFLRPPEDPNDRSAVSNQAQCLMDYIYNMIDHPDEIEPPREIACGMNWHTKGKHLTGQIWKRRNLLTVILAQHAGFCAGVRRSVETAYRLLDEAAENPTASPIYMYGELIHNRIVIDELKERGMRILDRIEDAEPGSTIIVRAHGITPQEKSALEATGCRVVDCTCGYVQHIHKLVREVMPRKTYYHCGQSKLEIIGINGECEHSAKLYTNTGRSHLWNLANLNGF